MENLHSSYFKRLRSSPPLTELQGTLSNVPPNNVLIPGLWRQPLSQKAYAESYSYNSKIIALAVVFKQTESYLGPTVLHKRTATHFSSIWLLMSRSNVSKLKLLQK